MEASWRGPSGNYTLLENKRRHPRSKIQPMSLWGGVQVAARKAGSIIPKGRNKHLIRWFIGRGPDGKRRYASKTIDGTFSQAQKALGKETHDVSEGSYVGPAKQTVGEYMTAWLRDVAATE